MEEVLFIWNNGIILYEFLVFGVSVTRDNNSDKTGIYFVRVINPDLKWAEKQSSWMKSTHTHNHMTRMNFKNNERFKESENKKEEQTSIFAPYFMNKPKIRKKFKKSLSDVLYFGVIP